MTAIISSDAQFSADERAALGLLSDWMIPAGDGMPSAADPEILARVLSTLATHRAVVIDGLQKLQQLAHDAGVGGPLQLQDASGVVDALKGSHGQFVSVLQSAVAASYYRDDRVLRGLGLAARAPYPEGNPVPDTDWSLLDPVRSRAPFYRQV